MAYLPVMDDFLWQGIKVYLKGVSAELIINPQNGCLTLSNEISMKNDQKIAAKIHDAMNDFIDHLPDAARCFPSTIINEILVEENKIIFLAQKRKGINGMCWEIRYKAIAADHMARSKT